MASNLTDQVRSISEVTKAVALGDLSKVVNVDTQGEMLDLKMTVNSMVAQLSTLANEVTRVSPKSERRVFWEGRRICLTFRECGRFVVLIRYRAMVLNRIGLDGQRQLDGHEL